MTPLGWRFYIWFVSIILSYCLCILASLHIIVTTIFDNLLQRIFFIFQPKGLRGFSYVIGHKNDMHEFLFFLKLLILKSKYAKFAYKFLPFVTMDYNENLTICWWECPILNIIQLHFQIFNLFLRYSYIKIFTL